MLYGIVGENQNKVYSCDWQQVTLYLKALLVFSGGHKELMKLDTKTGLHW